MSDATPTQASPGPAPDRDGQISFLSSIPLFSAIPLEVLSQIQRKIRLITISVNENLIEENSSADCMYILYSGRLVVWKSGISKPVGEIGPGEFVGETAILANSLRKASVVADEDCQVFRLDRQDILPILTARPAVMKTVAGIITTRTRSLQNRFFRPPKSGILAFLKEIGLFRNLSSTSLSELEANLQWQPLQRGEILMSQGDETRELYIVFSGRLEFEVSGQDGAVRYSGSIGRGALVGEMSMITGEPRSATVRAGRDSEVLAISEYAQDQLMYNNNAILREINALLANRLRSNYSESQKSSRVRAFIPIQEDADLDVFLSSLKTALAEEEKLSLIESGDIGSGKSSNRRRERDLSRRIREEERNNGNLILVGDAEDPDWNSNLIQRADRITLIADPAKAIELSPFELQFIGDLIGGGNGQLEIILLHASGEIADYERIVRLLELRSHPPHHHIRAGNSADIRRLIRFITGNTVGLALSGGGARGLAHIGIIKAFREAGIEIDYVTGTSIGALVGAAIAREDSIDEMKSTAWQRLVSARPLRDPVFPGLALLRGKKISREIMEEFGERPIETLPIRFCAIATDIIEQREVRLDRGSFWRAIRGSLSLPGIMPPILYNDRILADGGLINNSPYDVLKRSEIRTGILVTLDASPSRELDDYRSVMSDLPSGTAPGFPAYVRQKIMRRKPWPGMAGILMNSLLASSSMTARTQTENADIHISVDTGDYSMFDFTAMNELIDLGYRSALELLDGDAFSALHINDR